MSNYLDIHYQDLKSALSHKRKFSVDDAYKVLGLKKSTTLWLLSQLSREGRILRIGRGFYTFDERERSFRAPRLGDELKVAIDKLKYEGITFVLTGLDILIPFVQHQPARIMHLIYTATGAGSWAQSILKESEFTPVIDPTRQEIEKILEIISDRSELIILREKSSRLATTDSLATIERAFIDLYVESTRELIPFPVQEVAYIYMNMKASLTINTAQMLRYAHERSIRNEIREILEPEKRNNNSYLNKYSQNFIKTLKAIS